MLALKQFVSVAAVYVLALGAASLAQDDGAGKEVEPALDVDQLVTFESFQNELRRAVLAMNYERTSRLVRRRPTISRYMPDLPSPEKQWADALALALPMVAESSKLAEPERAELALRLAEQALVLKKPDEVAELLKIARRAGASSSGRFDAASTRLQQLLKSGVEPGFLMAGRYADHKATTGEGGDVKLRDLEKVAYTGVVVPQAFDRFKNEQFEGGLSSGNDDSVYSKARLLQAWDFSGDIAERVIPGYRSSILFRGYVLIDDDGTYGFRMRFDEEGVVAIDGREVQRGMYTQSVEVPIALDAGFHEIEIRGYLGGGPNSVSLALMRHQTVVQGEQEREVRRPTDLNVWASSTDIKKARRTASR